MTDLEPPLASSPVSHLTIEDVSCVELADEFGTPLFVISEGAIRQAFRRFAEAFASNYPNDVVICVGIKANWGLAIRRVIADEGGGGDAFGLGELYIALLAGTDPAKLVMNGPNKSDETLTAALQAGVMINVDNLDELVSLKALARQWETTVRIALRIRPPLTRLKGTRYTDARYGPPGIDVAQWLSEYKFGMEPRTLFEAIEQSLGSTELDLQGIHYHGGIPRRAGYYREEVDDLMDLIASARDTFHWEPQVLNLGGGFVPPRRGQDQPPTIEYCAEEITLGIIERCQEFNLTIPRLFLEPGRYCLENAVVWLTRVGDIKHDVTLSGKKWVYVDGNINEVGDPFDRFAGFHEIVVANDLERPINEIADVCGQLCNAADVLAAGRRLPSVRRGDLLAFLDMGAYKESFANQSNATPRSASVMVNGTRRALVRRRETVQDLFAREAFPPWLSRTSTAEK